MGDLDYKLLAEALMGPSITAAIDAQNPYTPFMGVPNSVAQAAMASTLKNPTGSNMGQSTAIGAISGLLEGLLGNKAIDYKANMLSTAAPGFITGERPEDVTDAVWNAINLERKKSALVNLSSEIGRENDFQDAIRLEKTKSDLGILNKLVETATLGDNPAQRARASKLLSGLFGRQAEAEGSPATEIGAGAMPTGSPGALPTSAEGGGVDPKYQELYDKYGPSVADSLTVKGGEDWLARADANTRQQILQADSVTTELYNFGQDFKGLGINALQVNAGKQLASTDIAKMIGRAQLLIAPVVRLSGDVGNIADREQARAAQAILADRTAGSETIGQMMQAAAGLYRRLILKKAELARTGLISGGDAVISELQRGLGQSTTPTSTTPLTSMVSPTSPTMSPAMQEFLRRKGKL